MEEALAALTVQGFLLAFGGVLGMLVERRIRDAPKRVVVGGAVVGAVLLSALSGLLSGQVAAAAAGALGWAVVFVVTLVVCSALPRVPAVLLGIVGGLAALQAMMIGFVLVTFTAVQAPRDQALWWLPAVMTGLVDDLGEPIDETVAPLWVRIADEVGLMPLIVLIAMGFVIAFLARRSTREQPAREVSGRETSAGGGAEAQVPAHSPES